MGFGYLGDRKPLRYFLNMYLNLLELEVVLRNGVLLTGLDYFILIPLESLGLSFKSL